MKEGGKEVLPVHSSFVSLIQDRARVRRLEGFSPLRAYTKTGRRVLRQSIEGLVSKAGFKITTCYSDYSTCVRHIGLDVISKVNL